jgi:hypothetical protein
MRSLLGRLVFIGLVSAVVAGCGISGGGSPSGALPNGNGGGSQQYTNNPTSTKTATPLFANPVVIDNGAEVTPAPVPSANPPTPTPAPILYTYKVVLGGSSKDTPLSGGVGASPYPTGGPSTAPSFYPSTEAEHLVTFSGGGLTQIVAQYSRVLPSLVYNFDSTAPTGTTPTYFDYSTIVMYLAYVPSTTVPPGTLVSVSAEITGSDAAGSFDVRIPCTGTPGTTAVARLSCGPLPALGAVSNTVGPNELLPGSLLGFDPVSAFSPKFNIVLNYSTPVPTTSTGNQLFITNVYALQ